MLGLEMALANSLMAFRENEYRQKLREADPKAYQVYCEWRDDYLRTQTEERRHRELCAAIRSTGFWSPFR